MISREVLVIDQAPILNEALEACRRAFAEIERLKQELAEHEGRDVPAYARWYHSTFGKVLTEIREAWGAIRDKETVLLAVRKRHWAKFFGSFSEGLGEPEYGPGHGDASIDDPEVRGDGFRVFEGDQESRAERREAWERGNTDDGAYGPGNEEARFGEDREFYDDEQDYADEDAGAAWFEQLFARNHRASAQGRYRSRGPGRQGGAEDPHFDEGDPDEEDMKSDRSGPGFARGRAGGRDHAGRAGKGGHAGMGNGEESTRSADGSKSVSGSVLSRVKDRYRILVKQLHPDLHPELPVEKAGLWNRVQVAYREANLEELDLLVALTGAISGSTPETASLLHLRHVSREIAILALTFERKLEEARVSRAWKFGVAKDAVDARGFPLARDREPLRKLVDRELQTDRARLWRRIRELDAQILRFSPKARSQGEARRARPDASV